MLQFSKCLAHKVTAIVCTQPFEPFPYERVQALRKAVPVGVEVVHYDKVIEQDPSVPGFWENWVKILESYGFEKGDTIVASERYGKRLAQELGGKFMPYDLDRDIEYTKATEVRENPFRYYDQILPEFRKHIQQRVTLFGCESTGKTTLSKALANTMNGYWLFEWARPYLENLDDNTITTEVMTDIWVGQQALQDHAQYLLDKPYIFQDTDLFSTVGYWDFWDMGTPPELVDAAQLRKSDLYIITPSNIPFEQDPLRYGGDKRESEDQYWIDLCERYKLNYIVLKEDNIMGRIYEVTHLLWLHEMEVGQRLAYDRMGM